MKSSHYYYHYQTGKRTLYMDEEDPRLSPKWQWVLKPSRRSHLHHNITGLFKKDFHIALWIVSNK